MAARSNSRAPRHTIPIMRKAIPFAFYFLYFAAAVSLIPFIVLYYQRLGFSGAQIGLAAGMAPLIALVGAPAGVLAFQFLKGLTFPAVWVAGVSFAYDNAPPGLDATAQGLFGAMVFGFGAAAGGLLGGLLLEAVGGRAMYPVFGVFVLGSLALLAPLERRLAPAPAR